MLIAGVVMAGAGLAGASFPGSANGNVAFASFCDGNIGQAIYSLNPNPSPTPTYTCPGGAAPNYTQSTAGSTDSMPYFSANGSTLYFASNRGSSGNFAIYQVAYPASVTGLPGQQSDGATQLTSPVNENDYAPTVSADGSTLAFIRCNTSNACGLYTQSPIVGGTPTLVATQVGLAPPDPTFGSADRPEFNPVNSSQIIYVGTDGHIHLVSLTGAFAERDLSSESGIGAGQADEYPDWSPTGTSIVFDTDRSGGHKIFVVNPEAQPATAAQLWSSDPGKEIEPIYGPDGSDFLWVVLGSGSNLQIDVGPGLNSATDIANLTSNKTTNSQPVWQPVPVVAQTPESPLALLLPLTAGGILIGSGLLSRRQYRRGLKPAAS